jgi:hypothetical protein
MIKLEKINWAGHVSLMGEKRNAWNIVNGRPQETRLAESVTC